MERNDTVRCRPVFARLHMEWSDMKYRIGLVVCGIAAMLLALFAIGCGGAECADGTVERDGECVLADDYQCEEGEVFSDGECIPRIECVNNAEEDNGQCVAEEPAECGPNTELDPELNECFVTEEACEGNTVFSSEEDQCVSTDDICESGTYFDEDTGLCYPDVQCQPGDVVSADGYCVSMAEYLADDIEVSADGVTDPDEDGTPAQLDVDAPGDEVIFGGELEEEDDTLLYDYFQFEADAGDWFELSVYSLGLPNPMFAVYSEEGELVDYERYSASMTGDDKSRQMLAPESGDYLVVVMPGAEATSLPADAEWDYVGVLEQLDAPDAEDYDTDDGYLQGALDPLTESWFYTDEYEEGDRLYVRWGYHPSGVEPAVQAWASETDVLAESDGAGVMVEVPESEELFVLIDWISAVGSHDQDYRLEVYDQVTDLEAGDSVEVEFDGSEGDFAHFAWRYDGTSTTIDVEVTVTDSDDEEVHTAEISADDTSTIRLPESGIYTAEFDNTSSSSLDGFTPMVDVIRHSIFAQESVGLEDLVYVDQHNDDGHDIFIELLDQDGEVLLEGDYGTDDQIEYFIDDPSVDTVEVWASDLMGSANLNVVVDIQSPQTAEDLTVEDDDVMYVEQTNPGGESVYLSVADDDGEVLYDGWTAAGQTLTLWPDAGDYTVSYYDTISGDPDVTAEVFSQQEGTSFSTDDGDLVSVEQTNSAEDATYVSVVEDSDGDVVLDEFMASGQPEELVLGDGDFTVMYYETLDSGSVATDVQTESGEQGDSFTSDEGDLVHVEQTNDDEEDVLVAVKEDDAQSAFFVDSVAHEETVELIVGQGEFTVWYYDADDVDGLSIDVQTEPGEQGASFTSGEGDLVHVEQTNDDEEDVLMAVKEDGEHGAFFLGSVAHEETLELLPGQGDFTVWYYDADDVDGLSVDADVIESDNVHSFTADTGALVEIGQTNDDEADALIAVVNEDVGEPVIYDELSDGTLYEFDARYGGQHEVYHFDVDDDIDGLEVTTEVHDPVHLDDFTVSGAEAPAVAEISHDQADELQIVVVSDDNDEIVGSDGFSNAILNASAFVALEAGDYSVAYRDVDDLGLDGGDVDVEVEIVVPEEVTDFEDSFTGSVSEHVYAPHDYYLVEVDSTTTVDISVERTIGSGFLHIIIYEPNFQQLYFSEDYTSSTEPEITSEFEFQADIPYVIRIGNYDTWDWDADYILTFDEQ